ncbi:hypothetical protein XA68_16683 [Ophiocordyceps unilateralis]|uniref:Ribosomal protein S11 n=1 Tax=Ophiocordyceps unilateralis TaxID=268505 RepID=A0A2A9PLA3_OPHUN|nr:hypothetical protein XA68_16683 [Ophiocordyceps unilateralis]
MSRALAGRMAPFQIVAPAVPCSRCRPRFLSQTTAQRSQEQQPPGPKYNPLTSVFRPGASPTGERKSQHLQQSDDIKTEPYVPRAVASLNLGEGSLPLDSQDNDAFRINLPAMDKNDTTKQTGGTIYNNITKQTGGKTVYNKKVAFSLYGSPRQSAASSDPLRQLDKKDPSHTMMYNSLRQSSIDTAVLDTPNLYPPTEQQLQDLNPHHLHVYAHKHNCHMTFTRPNRNPIISLSCGNIGFKKANRGLFDSAYSLAKYVFERLLQMNLKVNKLELVLRGYGEGRTAILKLLQSNDGAFLRTKIVRITDSTRLKFGGCRSAGPRRV